MTMLIAVLIVAVCSSQALAKPQKAKIALETGPERTRFQANFALQAMFIGADNECCTCGPLISVILIAENTLVEPTFNISAKVTTNQRELIYIMKKAVDDNENFRFTVSYSGSALGYYLTSINNVAPIEDPAMYWGITTQNGFTSGISSFIPEDGDVILFSLQVST